MANTQTNQSNTKQQAELKKGMLVYNKSTQQKGKLFDLNTKTGKAKVEVITAFNEQTQERTTRLVEMEAKHLTKHNKKREQKKYNPNETFYMVQDFHKAFGHEVNEKPTAIPVNTALNRAVWTGEELVEFLYATVKGDGDQFSELFGKFMDGLDKVHNKMLDQKKPVEDIIVAQADALTDVAYFNDGTFNILGVKPFNLFKIVQDSNMSKLFDGVAKYREDGKILKSPAFIEPEPKLKAEIERQANA